MCELKGDSTVQGKMVDLKPVRQDRSYAKGITYIDYVESRIWSEEGPIEGLRRF